MDIPLNVEVRCSDGAGGKSTVIIVHPGTQQVTHFVVDSHGSEYLVPIGAVAESGPDHILLHWSLAELAQAEPFVKVVYVGDAESAAAAGVPVAPAVVIPATMDAGYMTEAAELSFLRVEQLPEGAQALHRGAHVEASDGRVGSVDEFVVDATTGHITHLILRQGHLWGKHDIAVPLSAVERIQEDIVFLKLDKAAVAQLPHGRQPEG